jgi:hypothetical protein
METPEIAMTRAGEAAALGNPRAAARLLRIVTHVVTFLVLESPLLSN